MMVVRLPIRFAVEPALVGFRDRRAKTGFSGAPHTEYRAYAVLPGGLQILIGTSDSLSGAQEHIEKYLAQHQE